MTQLLSLATLLRMARDTISDPREGATTILSLGLPRQALWIALALVVVLSMLLGEIVFLMTELPDDGPLTGTVYQSPIAIGLLQAGLLFLMAHAITRIGRLFGGLGRFEEALALVVWLQFIFICVQVVQLAAMLVVPPVADLIMLFGLALFLWLLVHFIAALHGFTSIGMVFVMTILSAFVILFVLSVILTLLGISTGTT